MSVAGGERPITLLVSAIGGEGGGVLAGWIVAAARHAGYPVQSTSIPGVAQRTGATTYYLEVFPVAIDALGGRRPVLAIYPGVGDVDIMLASEFVEAGRAIANGFVTPDRTVLIASTHRVYAPAERGAMGDGRFDPERLFDAAARRAKRALVADLRRTAEEAGVSLNAVLLGVLAGTALLPMPRAAFEAAIRDGGIAVDANLRGFAAGHGFAFVEKGAGVSVEADGKRPSPPGPDALEARVAAGFPAMAHDILREGVRRLAGYQDAAYAALYLDRLAPIRAAEQAAGGDGTLTREVGRHLALRMAYEDVIRVAQLKCAPARYRRIRREVRAKEPEPVVVLDYFKPGIDELCAILPPRPARALLAVAERRGWRRRAHLGMRLRSSTVSGYLRLRLLAGLRRWRPRSHGFAAAQAGIELWLGDVTAACKLSVGLALEIAECARLIKGYGETHRRGTANFARIREAIILPVLDGALDPRRASDAIASARVAALADPEGGRLAEVLSAVSAHAVAHAAE